MPKLFRYEKMWETHDDFGDVLENKWGEDTAHTMNQLSEKLKRLSRELTEWSREEFGNVLKEIKRLKGQLVRLREEPGRRGPFREEIKVQDRLSELYHREEIMWHQRSIFGPR